jgi:hypothetical protein
MGGEGKEITQPSVPNELDERSMAAACTPLGEELELAALLADILGAARRDKKPDEERAARIR